MQWCAFLRSVDCRLFTSWTPIYLRAAQASLLQIPGPVLLHLKALHVCVQGWQWYLLPSNLESAETCGITTAERRKLGQH